MSQLLPLELIQSMTRLELDFAQLWDEYHPEIDLVFQYPFGRFKLDFCHPQTKVDIECQGGTWVPGLGHSSGKWIDAIALTISNRTQTP